MRMSAKYKHLIIGLIVLATMSLLDWLFSASDYPQG